MATFSDIRATFGLQAVATLAGDNLSGSVQVGVAQTSERLTSATKTITFDAVIVGASSDLVIDISDLDSTGSTAWTSGVAQVETATITAASGATSNGTMTLVVTADGMTGSPKNIAVALTTATHTTAALIAQAAVDALNADVAYSALFTATRSTANIVTTRKATSTYTVAGISVPIYPANDATLNIAIPSGLGVTAAALSANTTAGVATAGAYVVRLNGNDLEGVATGGMSAVSGVYIKNKLESSESVYLTQGTVLVAYGLPQGVTFQIAGEVAPLYTDDIKIEPGQDANVTVVIAGI